MCISFEEARAMPLLQVPDEQEAIRGWQECRDAGAAERLVRSHARLVHAIARRWARRPQDLDDLVSAGMVGLLRAAEEYDAGHKARFATYARWWIMTTVCKEVARQRCVLSLPARRYHDMIGGRLDEDEAAAVSAAVHGVVGIDAPLGPDRDDTLASRLPDDAPDAEAQMIETARRDDLRRILAEAIDGLKGPAREVMRLRAAETPVSHAVIARRMRLGTRQVRMIEKAAHLALRNTLRKRGFVPADLG